MFHSYIIELHAQAIAVTSYCLEEAFPTSSSTGTLDFGSACRACSDMFRSICYLNWLFRSVSCNSFDTSSYDHQRIQPNQLNPPWSPPSLPLENRWIRSEVPIRPVPPAAVRHLHVPIHCGPVQRSRALHQGGIVVVRTPLAWRFMFHVLPMKRAGCLSNKTWRSWRFKIYKQIMMSATELLVLSRFWSAALRNIFYWDKA